jgi:hypothetical protein
MRTLLQPPLHCLLPIFLLLALSLPCSHARAGAGTVDDRTQIIKDFVLQIPYLKKRFDGNSNTATEYPIVLMVTAESEFLKGLQLEDPAIIIMPQADVVAAQLASFASLSNLMVDGEHAVMRYDIPASDRSGEIRFRKKAGRWHKTTRNEQRSSGRARAYYGKLYMGAVCRNGTEMAYRWNYLLSRRAPSYPGTCPGTTFPDVVVYLEGQQRIPGK